MSARFADSLYQRICAEGQITLADYIAACAEHYYATRDPFGQKGDFTTAPEMSQMFGELIGLWLAQLWSQSPRSDSSRSDSSRGDSLLVELGAGRGTLMADMLRAGSLVKGFVESQRVFLIEQSPYLRAIQQRHVPAAHIIKRFDDLPRAPIYLVANEFFDALPIRQFEMSADGWRERYIGCAGDRLVWRLGDRADVAVPAALPDAEIGAIAEICPQADALIAQIAQRIKQYGGAAIIIDYGEQGTMLGDTLQAARRHQFHPVLEKPGEADITDHVRFGRLIAIAREHGLHVPPLMTQKFFLETLGIEARAQRLIKNATADEARDIRADLRRLTAPDEMGSLFKVMMALPAADT